MESQLRSFSLHRAETYHGFKLPGLLQIPQDRCLLLSRSGALELQAHVARSWRDLNVEHQCVQWFQDVIDLGRHPSWVAVGDLVAIDHSLEIHPTFSETQNRQHSEDEQSRKDSQPRQPASDCHAD